MRDRLITVYIIREFLLSFPVAFLFFFFIFFVNQILVMAEEIFSRRSPSGTCPLRDLLPAGDRGAVLPLRFAGRRADGGGAALRPTTRCWPWVARRAAAPALRAAGGHGALFSFVSFVVNDYFLPLGNIRLARDVPQDPVHQSRRRAGAVLGEEVRGRGRSSPAPWRAGRSATWSSSTGTPTTASGSSPPARPRSRRAASRRGSISLRLEDVFSQAASSSAADNSTEYTAAEQMIYNILLKDLSGAIMNPGPRR